MKRPLRRRYEDDRVLIINVWEVRETEVAWGQRMVSPLYAQAFGQR